MHIKTINTNSKHKCIVMRGNDLGRVNRGKDIGPSTSWTAMMFSRALTVFTLALTEAARSIFLLCFLD